MKRIAIISVICLAGSVLSALASNPQMFIYRNDKRFNRVEMSHDTRINHGTNGAQKTMTVAGGENDGFTVALLAIDSCVVRRSDIPTLHFKLTDYPDATGLWDKELYLNTTLDVKGFGYVDDQPGLALTIKGRGNSTWNMLKKPVRLKFAKKTALCGFKKAKSFVLLANYIDNSLCKNAVAMWIARRIGVPYANTTMPCNVIINNTFQGSYLLTEKVGINGASVDIDEEKGILFELSTEYDEKYKFHSQFYKLPVMVKDPDFDELYEENPDGKTPDTRLALWKADFLKAERQVFLGKGFEAFDLDAFVRYMLLYNLVNNSELSHPKSTYINKEALGDTCKYVFGPAWDFDVTCNFINSENKPRPAHYDLSYVGLIGDLIGTPEFMPAYKKAFNDFLENDYADMLAFLDAYGALIEPSAKLDGIKWPLTQGIGGWAFRTSAFDAKKHVADLRQWLIDRVEYLKNRLQQGKF